MGNGKQRNYSSVGPIELPTMERPGEEQLPFGSQQGNGIPRRSQLPIFVGIQQIETKFLPVHALMLSSLTFF